MKHHKILQRNLLGFLVTASIALPTAVQAQQYDFKACVDTALAQNPEMEVSAARINQAEAALSKAESSRLPQITLSVTGSHSDNALNVFGMKLQQRQAALADFGFDNNVAEQFGMGNFAHEPDSLNNPDAQSDINSRIEVLLPVWNGGKIGSYEDQAESMIEAAKNGDVAVQQFLTFNIYQAYEAVHAARAYIEVAKQAQETADSFVKTTRNLVDQGVVVRSEFLSAKVNQSAAKSALAKAKSEEKIALHTLKMLMNVDPNADVDVADRLDLQLPIKNPEDLVMMALASNPQLDAKRKQAEASTHEVRAAKSDNYPSFNMMLRQDWNDESLSLANSSYTVAGVLSWKITDFGVTKGSIDMANAAAAQKKSEARSEENKVRLQVLTAWNKLKAAEEQVLTNLLAVQQANEAKDLVMKRYNNGISTITELLAANTQLDKARAELVSARYEVNVQKAQLLLATGRMDTSQL
jgi:outer membrane protein TolC